MRKGVVSGEEYSTRLPWNVVLARKSLRGGMEGENAIVRERRVRMRAE